VNTAPTSPGVSPAPVRPPRAPFPSAPPVAPRPARPDAETTFRLPGRPGAAARASPLHDIEGARARIDALLAEARRGRTFSAAELLCLQADAHRFAQSVEITARAVEHGVQGLRQALQAQV
jgi:hypothetical protein